MRSSSKLPSAWGRLLSLLGLALLAGACSTSMTDIGVGLPDANANTGAYLIDTLTVRSSTVLRDSVVTSTSNSLVAGRYTDPLLGTVQAKSFFRLGLGSSFTPDASYIYDSVALVLKPTANHYRYGDTTKLQTLFAVYPMLVPVSNSQVSFASRKLTPLSYDSTQLLNQSFPIRKARPNITTLRLRLRDDFGRKLLATGVAGLLRSQDDFVAYLPGLAVMSSNNDDATILTMDATSADTGLFLYYHSPTDATTALSTSFLISSGGAHCFQVSANRSKGAIGVNNLPSRSLAATGSARTGENTFVEGALGLQTKLEFPYLANLRQVGQYITVTSAVLTAQVPATTLTPYLPTPPSLAVSLANINNQPTTPYTTAAYQTGQSTLTGLDQGSYSWSVVNYVQAVLNNTLPNNGMLLASSSPDLPTRVALGSQRSVLNKLQLRIYLISLN